MNPVAASICTVTEELNLAPLVVSREQGMSVCGISDTCVFGILRNKMFTILSAANVHHFIVFMLTC